MVMIPRIGQQPGQQNMPMGQGAPQQPAPQQQAPAMGQGGFGIPMQNPAAAWGVGSWGYQPQTNPYAQAMGAQASTNRDTAEMGLYGQLAALPYGLAGTLAQSIPQAQASMFGADRMGRAQEYSSYYPAAADIQTAHMDPWAQTQSTRMQALAGQNIAQINAERQLYGLMAMLQGIMPMFNQSQPQMPSIGTDYGAGIGQQAA